MICVARSRASATSVSDTDGNIRPADVGCPTSAGRGHAYTALMEGLLQIEDCLDADGGIVLPPGVTLIGLIDRNIANVGDTVAYRYLDFTRSEAGQLTEVTWTQ